MEELVLGYPHKNQGENSFEMFEEKQDESRENSWFLGTLIQLDRRVPSHFYRLKNTHNSITHEETGCDNRFQINNDIASRLAEFFPLKWLDMITNSFKNIKPKELGLRLQEDRLYAYLAYIDLVLTFRGLSLLDSTLQEISNALGVDLNKQKLRTWRLRLLKIYPKMRNKWRKIRSETPARVLLSTLIRIMNTEINYEGYSDEEIFDIKHRALKYGQLFAAMDRVARIKRLETWVRAICIKSIRDNHISYTCQIFPSITSKEFDVLENKRWQLDKML